MTMKYSKKHTLKWLFMNYFYGIQTLTLLFAKPVEEPTGIIRRSHGRCPLKNLFLKISQYSYEKTFLSLFFNKVAGLNAVKESMNFLILPSHGPKFSKMFYKLKISSWASVTVFMALQCGRLSRYFIKQNSLVEKFEPWVLL